MPGSFAMGTLMLILCYSSLQGLCSLTATRYFCRSIQDLVPLKQSASPRPLRRHAVHSEDTESCTKGHSMPAPLRCPPGHLVPSQPYHADSQPGRDGQLFPHLPSCHPGCWALPPTTQVHLHHLSWRRSWRCHQPSGMTSLWPSASTAEQPSRQIWPPLALTT